MSGEDPGTAIVLAWRAIRVATDRAQRAEMAAGRVAGRAERQDRLAAAANGSLGEFHAQVALRHRAAERRLLMAAGFQRDYAWAMTLWLAQRAEYGLARPLLMGPLAESAGWQAAVLTLGARPGVERLVAASGRWARRVHELEMVVGEGPSWEALDGHASAASGSELPRLWPRYGPAVARLGVQAVAAVPVGFGSDQVGALTVTGAVATVGRRSGALVDLAEALHQVVCAPDAVRCEQPDLPGLEQLAAEDHQAELHQAAGVLQERLGLAVADAIALIRAHAYAEERSVADVAVEVLAGGVLEP